MLEQQSQTLISLEVISQNKENIFFIFTRFIVWYLCVNIYVCIVDTQNENQELRQRLDDVADAQGFEKSAKRTK
jgi:predicted amino acid-binding ACT domain protein